MDDTPTYEELAQSLLAELGAIGRAVGPKALNATRGETATLMSLSRAETPLTPHAARRARARVQRAHSQHPAVPRGEGPRHAHAHGRRSPQRLRGAHRRGARPRAAEIRDNRTRTVVRYLEALGPDDAAELVRIARRSRDVLVEALAREVVE